MMDIKVSVPVLISHAKTFHLRMPHIIIMQLYSSPQSFLTLCHCVLNKATQPVCVSHSTGSCVLTHRVNLCWMTQAMRQSNTKSQTGWSSFFNPFGHFKLRTHF
eukprot:Blabericola_migrator_1__6340@NODE_319_length_9881_cov_31_716324_g77_i1_p7_GENE_NODE_319_length_9881_cov_31_716324_g77_i1NODE_319_length_9881_cov_31_716324_g77_i1_p7_ORF_typecomplete_len104_score20_05IBN_N/PF03810_19/0_23_NODE_319_length_9881_cov_31_716324_g77_i135443855